MRPIKEIIYEGYKVRVFPPQQGAMARPVHPLLPGVYDWDQAAMRLVPDHPSAVDGIMIDEKPIFPHDLLVIDFLNDSFDRTETLARRAPDVTDPPTELIFRLANEVLDRLRAVSRGSNIKPISRNSVHWRIAYLNDDGTQLPPQAGFVGARYGAFSAARPWI